MKIAVSGKGGVGKTTFVATLARVFAENGKKGIAIDADPVANLAVTLGIKNVSEIVPFSQMKDLIKERTGATSEEYGKFFQLNPTVSDLPDKLSLEQEGIKLMVLGAAKRGGGGCACPESAFLRTLLSHLIVQRDEVVIADMEAGVEHLGRATVKAVNALIVIVEPGSKSIQTAFQVKKLADDIGLKAIYAVGNKVASDEHRALIEKGLNGIPVLGFISYNEKVLESDIVGKAVFAENSPYRRTRLRRTRRGSLVSTAVVAAVGVLYGAAVSGMHPHAILMGAVIGAVVGGLGSAGETLFFQPHARRLSFAALLVLRSAFYLLLIAVTVPLVVAAHEMLMGARSFAEAVQSPGFVSFFLGGEILRTLLLIGASVLAINFIRQVNRLLGTNAVRYFLTGTYHRPVEERRIFMFLDLTSSTAIAEKLGHSG